jgi:hypothetical protein
MRARTDRIHAYRSRPAMSGRVRKDLGATFLRGRFLIPTVIGIVILAVVIWLIRGH